MCQTQSFATHVRIMRCPHGTNYVSLGNITLALNDAELVLIDQAIHILALKHPVFPAGAVRRTLREQRAPKGGDLMNSLILDYFVIAVVAGYSAWLIVINCRDLARRRSAPSNALTRSSS